MEFGRVRSEAADETPLAVQLALPLTAPLPRPLAVLAVDEAAALLDTAPDCMGRRGGYDAFSDDCDVASFREARTSSRRRGAAFCSGLPPRLPGNSPTEAPGLAGAFP